MKMKVTRGMFIYSLELLLVQLYKISSLVQYVKCTSNRYESNAAEHFPTMLGFKSTFLTQTVNVRAVN